MLRLHLQPILAWRSVYTHSIRDHAMLAVRLFTGALYFLRPKLDVRRVVSRNSQATILEHDSR